MRLAPLMMIFGLWACAPFPQITSTTDPQAATPRLVPLAPLLAQATAGPVALPVPLDARIARLTQRAARLRGPVIDPATRARMSRGVRDRALRSP